MSHAAREQTADQSEGDRLVRDIARSIAKEVAAARRSVSKPRTRDDDIHAARKSLKRARAGLRLLRGALGEQRYRRANNELRNAARVLARMRDAKVLHAAVQDLLNRVRKNAHREILSAYAAQLRNERRDIEQIANRKGGDLERVRDALSSFERDFAFDNLNGGWPAICEGVSRTYLKGRRAMRRARKSDAAEDMHDWRKQAKYLAQQLVWLDVLHHRKVKDAGKVADKIADGLGTGHDFAVLSERIRQMRSMGANPHVPALLDVLQKKRARAEAKALRLARKIYGPSPGELARRYSRYWRERNAP